MGVGAVGIVEHEALRCKGWAVVRERWRIGHVSCEKGQKIWMRWLRGLRINHGRTCFHLQGARRVRAPGNPDRLVSPISSRSPHSLQYSSSGLPAFISHSLPFTGFLHIFFSHLHASSTIEPYTVQRTPKPIEAPPWAGRNRSERSMSPLFAAEGNSPAIPMPSKSKQWNTRIEESRVCGRKNDP